MQFSFFVSVVRAFTPVFLLVAGAWMDCIFYVMVEFYAKCDELDWGGYLQGPQFLVCGLERKKVIIELYVARGLKQVGCHVSCTLPRYGTHA